MFFLFVCLTTSLSQPVTVMEHQQSINLEEEFEAPEAVHTGNQVKIYLIQMINDCFLDTLLNTEL